MTDGVLVIDKPAGMTSHDVVDSIRKVFHTKKVGHGGTLDPDATGILILGLGRATRFLAYSQGAPKRYSARARFGIATSTQDASGEVIAEHPADVTEDQVVAALQGFRGPIEQVPPMVSAVKVGGERLYKKARRGEEVDRPPRAVEIHSLELTSFDHPHANLDVVCSGGTYIRTLVHDLGATLGCGAHLVELRRTEAGGFTLDDAVLLKDASPDALRPLLDAVRQLPSIEADDGTAEHVSHGRALPAPDGLVDGTEVAVVRDGELLGVYKREGEALKPDRVVAS